MPVQATIPDSESDHGLLRALWSGAWVAVTTSPVVVVGLVFLLVVAAVKLWRRRGRIAAAQSRRPLTSVGPSARRSVTSVNGIPTDPW